MQDSITIADVGSMVKVSGSRIATPLGPPRPGSTPTKLPSTSPTIISSSVFHVSSTAKPCIKRPLRHDDVKGDVERDEHRGGEDEGGEQRLPQRDLPDQPHEGGDQQKTRDIE